jgi:hypothetical protein
MSCCQAKVHQCFPGRTTDERKVDMCDRLNLCIVSDRDGVFINQSLSQALRHSRDNNSQTSE